MKRLRLAPAAIAAAAIVILSGCSGPIPNRDPTGELFPTVVGESLREERVELPTDLAGETVVLLVGYEQDAQFDIDRWLMGILQAEVDANLLEVPTIPGLMATMASGFIDDGMRGGIPVEDWSLVVTLYGSSAQPVAEFTGTTNGQLARVLVLDETGRVTWFDDKGYSARKALDLARFVSSPAEE